MNYNSSTLFGLINVCNNLTLSTQNNKNLSLNLFNIVPYKRKSKYELDT